MNNSTAGGDESEQVPVSSENFELWIRMATDNKINATNTWNFALIDYFHDFSVLRDGDGVNFQKASATLDGCMKIYSHRIDSAARDTGTLLSSLNISSKQDNSTNIEKRNEVNGRNNHVNIINKDGVGVGAGVEEYDDEEEEEGGENNNVNNIFFETDEVDGQGGNKRKSKFNKKSKNLANSFNSIKIKDQDRPVKPDPVFKKALTDFDEGGAKSLLNNILRISKDAKVVFDMASDAATEMNNEEEEASINLNFDKSKFDFNDLRKYVTFDLIGESLDICPSLNDLRNISEGTAEPATILEKLDALDISRIESDMQNVPPNTNNISNEGDGFDFCDTRPDFGYNSDINMEDFKANDDSNKDNNTDMGLDEDDRISNTSRRTQYSLYMDGVENSDESGPNLTLNRLFDESAARKSDDESADDDYTPGGELNPNERAMINLYDDIGTRPAIYWKILRLRRSLDQNQSFGMLADDELNETENQPKRASKRKGNKPKKQQMLINFMSDDEDLDEEKIFTQVQYLSKITMTNKTKNKSSWAHIIEEGSTFTAKRLAFLSTKPKQLINSVLVQKRKHTHEEKERDNVGVDEAYFAQNYIDENNPDILNDSILSDDVIPIPDYNQYDDFGPNGMEGYEAQLNSSYNASLQKDWPSQSESEKQNQSLNRTEAISYAKRSKKVDVKLLKQNIWSSIEEISIRKKKRAASHFEDEEEEKGQEEKEWENGDNMKQLDSTKGQNILNEGFSEGDCSTENHGHESNEFVGSTGLDTMNFSNVVEIMSSKYNTKVKRDLSTSFCFICLLHLANEQGLTLEALENHEDLIIYK